MVPVRSHQEPDRSDGPHHVLAHGCARPAHRQAVRGWFTGPYLYENASSRLRQVIDEKQQITQFTYNRDNTLKSMAYANATVPTPGVSYTYDPNYQRVISMTDGTGTTLYSYNPITATPTLGAEATGERGWTAAQ